MDETDKPKPPLKNKGHANVRPKPWKKGQSGNPKGKKPGTKNRATILNELLGIKLTKNPDANFALPKGVTVEQSLAVGIISKAQQGDVTAYREIMDTVYGKIADKHEFSGVAGAPIETATKTVTVKAATAAEAAAAYARMLKGE